MFVKSIHWMDKEDKEAEVIVSDGKNEILCFSHPFSGAIGDILVNPLECMDAEEIQILDDENFNIEKIDPNDYFEYKIGGKLISADKKLVLVGDLLLSLEGCDIPKDLKNNNFVTFITSRINIF